MKRLMCGILSIVMLFSLLCSNVFAAEDDVIMLYDGEGSEGNGFQNPWGNFAGLDMDYYTEGTAGFAMQAFNDKLMFFQNTFDYLGTSVDVSGYEYIEFDIMSYYGMYCNVEISLVSSLTAHHGSDIDMADPIYLPPETFVHFKLPLSECYEHATYDKDRWDTATDGGNDEEHYAGYSLDNVMRLRWQFTNCLTAGGDIVDDIYMVFDNVTVSRNGAGMDSTMEYWEDVEKAVLNKTYEPKPHPTAHYPESEEPDPDPNPDPNPQPPVTETDVKLGDVDGDKKVNSADALQVLKAAVKKIDLNEKEFAAADIDKNGAVNSADALEILKYAVKKPSLIPDEV